MKNRFLKIITHRLAVICILCVVLLNGCFWKPKGSSLPQNLPPQWSFVPKISGLPVTRSLLDLFDNPELEKMVNQALDQNHNLKATALRFRASEITFETSRYNTLPTARVSFLKSRDNHGFHRLTGEREKQNHHRASLNIDWELDIWGKLADQRNAESVQSEIKRLEYRGAYDSLAARVIQTCLNIAGTQRLLQVQKTHVANLEKIEQSISRRYYQGIGSIKDLSAARTRTWTGKALISEVEENLNESRRMLGVYMGQYPDSIALFSKPVPTVELPVFSAPAEVLLNRPDIQKALLNIKAEQLEALAAKKEMLPSFNLTADWGKKGSTVSNLLNGDALWRLVGSVVQPVFQGKRLINRTKAVELAADASVSDMMQAVVSALKEVEDRLGMEFDLNRQESFLKEALSEAEMARADYRQRYRNGLVSLIDLLVTIEQETQIKTKLIQTQTRRLSNRVDLALAAGIGA